MRNRISPQAASQILGLSEFTLAKMRREKRGPSYVRVSRNRVEYFEDSCHSWIEARTVEPDQAA